MPTKKKPINKKSLEYVRPQPGTFQLERFPGVEFKFRMITVDDESWCITELGKTPWAIMTNEKAQTADLCRLYFYFLEDEFKKRFVPVKKEEMDYETGEIREVVISGPRLFMQSIDGGSLTEMMLISRAFTQTILASRPLDALPDDVKKNLMESIKKHQETEKKKAETPSEEPGPMGSTIVDLRPPKTP